MSLCSPNFIVITAVDGSKHAIDISEIKTLTDDLPDNIPKGVGLTMGTEITAVYMRDESCYLTNEKLDKLLARIKRQS